MLKSFATVSTLSYMRVRTNVSQRRIHSNKRSCISNAHVCSVCSPTIIIVMEEIEETQDNFLEETEQIIDDDPCKKKQRIQIRRQSHNRNGRQVKLKIHWWAWRAKLWDVFGNDYHSHKKKEKSPTQNLQPYSSLAETIKNKKKAGLRTQLGQEFAKVKALLNEMLIMRWNHLPPLAFTGFNEIEQMLRQMLKPFAWALTHPTTLTSKSLHITISLVCFFLF